MLVDPSKFYANLKPEENEALVKIARILSEEPDGPDRVRKLIDAQVDLLELVSYRDHVAWFWRMMLKAGIMAGVLTSVIGAWKLFFGK